MDLAIALVVGSSHSSGGLCSRPAVAVSTGRSPDEVAKCEAWTRALLGWNGRR